MSLVGRVLGKNGQINEGCTEKTSGKANVGVVGLQTVLVEIEAVINYRPLTYVRSDDVESCLTPSHLFCGKRILDLLNREIQLGLLDSYHFVRKAMAKRPKVADLVLIKEDKKRRHFWKVGKITELIM